MALLTPVKRSAWQFQTSGTGGVGIGVVVASGGEIKLSDPDNQTVAFQYGAVGAGLSLGLKRVPKIGRFIDPRGLSEAGGGVVAPESFPNHGVVYVMEGCQGSDLTADDFRGISIFYDAGLGIVAGYACEALLLNVDRVAFACLFSGNPILNEVSFVRGLRPHAMLLSWGPNIGLQANAGISESVGYVS